MNSDMIRKAGEIIANNTSNGTYKNDFCILALTDSDGRPTASAITPSKSSGIEWITFCTGLDGNKAARIEKCGKAGVCFASESCNITLAGEIEIITDPEVKREMWYSGLEQHFSGADDPNYCVLRFVTKRFNLFVDRTEAVGTL